VLDYRLNRVQVKDDGGSAAPKTYDLEVEQDSFWRKNAPRPFPKAIDDNSSELERIKQQEKEIKNKTAGGGESAPPDGMAASVGDGGGTQELLATVDSLPKLLEVRLLPLCSTLPSHDLSIAFFFFRFDATTTTAEKEEARITYQHTPGGDASHCSKGAPCFL
jgi:hypothetical protein